ncbi:MAG: hypothetical protein KatS3mg102_0005 [Planctomycetota bacterium]|nr:MAG: hypothetical protein KatS3mg102_0005 [Planctomycetota bacterium]
MDEQTYERRGLFDGLRVPFDPNMLLLATGCVIATHLFAWLIGQLTGDEAVLERIGAWVFSLGQREVGLKPVTWILAGLVGLGLWSFFSAAINRIAAMKIAREETIPIRDAARFAARKFLPVLFSVGFVAIIFAFFYLVTNATIFGWLARVPLLDVLVVGLLFPLVLLFTFFVVFSVALGLFGFNLASSAIATESSDTWDGITRAWNYILERPWHTILVLGLTSAFLVLVLFFGGLLLDWSVGSLSAGWWGAGRGTVLVAVDGEDMVNMSDEIRRAARFPGPDEIKGMSDEKVKLLYKTEYRIAVPAKGSFIEGYVRGQYRWKEVPYTPSREEMEAFREAKVENLVAGFGLNVASLIPWHWKLTAWLVWLWHWLVTYFIAGYMLQYFFGANTLLYFLLRREVEGEDYSEIVLEEEELEEAGWEIKEPAAPSGEEQGAAVGSALAEPAAAASAGERAGAGGGNSSSPAEGGEQAPAGAEETGGEQSRAG